MSQIPVEAVVTEYPQDAQGSEEEEPEIPPPPPLVRQYRLEAGNPEDANIDLEPPRKKARINTAPALLELPPGDYIVRVSLRDISIQRLWVPQGTPVEIVHFERGTVTADEPQPSSSGNC